MLVTPEWAVQTGGGVGDQLSTSAGLAEAVWRSPDGGALLTLTWRIGHDYLNKVYKGSYTDAPTCPTVARQSRLMRRVSPASQQATRHSSMCWHVRNADATSRTSSGTAQPLCTAILMCISTSGTLRAHRPPTGRQLHGGELLLLVFAASIPHHHAAASTHPRTHRTAAARSQTAPAWTE